MARMQFNTFREASEFSKNLAQSLKLAIIIHKDEDVWWVDDPTGKKIDTNQNASITESINSHILTNQLDENGFNKDGYDRDGYNIYGWNKDGFDSSGFDRKGYNKDGYDKEGYGRPELVSYHNCQYRSYNISGNDNEGYDRAGFNSIGRNREGYDKEGFKSNGFNRLMVHKDTNTKYDPRGYDVFGMDKSNNKGENKPFGDVVDLRKHFYS